MLDLKTSNIWIILFLGVARNFSTYAETLTKQSDLNTYPREKDK